LVDFDPHQRPEDPLSVGPVSVTTAISNISTISSSEARQELGPEHIMASGALPPGFPSIEIEGEHFWTAASPPIRRSTIAG